MRLSGGTGRLTPDCSLPASAGTGGIHRPPRHASAGTRAFGDDCQQFGFVEKMDAAGPVPEARSDASHVPLSLVIVTVKSGGGEPRLMTTVTLPVALATADKTWGAVFRPF